jgi:hypothetical protein
MNVQNVRVPNDVGRTLLIIYQLKRGRATKLEAYLNYTVHRAISGEVIWDTDILDTSSVVHDGRRGTTCMVSQINMML